LRSVNGAIQRDDRVEWPQLFDPDLDGALMGGGVQPHWKESIGFVCRGTRAGKQAIGTAFFVQSLENSKTFATKYLVTAKHVVDGARKLSVRLNTIDGNNVDYLALPPFSAATENDPANSGWHVHDDPAIDLAVTEIEGARGQTQVHLHSC
jgi:S1-C subfamily serine protease